MNLISACALKLLVLISALLGVPSLGNGSPVEQISYHLWEPTQNAFNITFTQFARALIWNGFPIPYNAQFDQYIAKSQSVGGIQSKLEMAMFLAQIIHESIGLQYKSELGCPSAQKCLAYQNPSWTSSTCGANLNQPCHQTPFSGQLYYGRGYIQLSWPVNYESASWALYGTDILYRQPDLVATEPVAWETAFWYWKGVVKTDPRVQKGMFGAATMAINGIPIVYRPFLIFMHEGPLECLPNGNVTRAKQRFGIYEKVFQAFALQGTPDERGCYS